MELCLKGRIVIGIFTDYCYNILQLQKQYLTWHELPSASCPLLFHGIVGDNLQEGDSPSWFNAAEAFQVRLRNTRTLTSFTFFL